MHKLTMASFNRRMIKYPQMECVQGYVTIFLDSPMVPGTSYLVFRFTMTSTIQRMVNYRHQQDVTLYILGPLFSLKQKTQYNKE